MRTHLAKASDAHDADPLASLDGSPVLQRRVHGYACTEHGPSTLEGITHRDLLTIICIQGILPRSFPVLLILLRLQLRQEHLDDVLLRDRDAFGVAAISVPRVSCDVAMPDFGVVGHGETVTAVLLLAVTAVSAIHAAVHHTAHTSVITDLDLAHFGAHLQVTEK